MGDLRAVEPLTQVLGELYAGDERCAAVEALVKLADLRAVEPLIKTLGDDRPFLRYSAAKALGELGDKRAVEALTKALLDAVGVSYKGQSLFPAVAAAEALDKLGESKWKQWVKNEGDDFAPIAALAASHEPRALQLLIEALKDYDEHIRQKAAKALGKAAYTPAVEPLIKALNDNAEALRGGHLNCGLTFALIEALGEIGDKGAVQPLCALLNGRRVGDVIRGLSGGGSHFDFTFALNVALGKLGDARAVDPLIKALLGDCGRDVRSAAAKALGTLGDRRAIEALTKALGDQIQDVRSAAAEALEKLRQS